MHNNTTCPHIDHKECLSLVQLQELKSAQEKHQGDIEALVIDLASALDREQVLRNAIQAIVDCTMEPEGEISCECIEHAKSLLHTDSKQAYYWVCNECGSEWTAVPSICPFCGSSNTEPSDRSE